MSTTRSPKGRPVPRPYVNKSGQRHVDSKGRLGWRLRFTAELDGRRVNGTFYGSYEDAVRELDRRMNRSAKQPTLSRQQRSITLYDYAKSWAEAYRYPKQGVERVRTTWKEHDGNVHRYIRPFLEQQHSIDGHLPGKSTSSSKASWKHRKLREFTPADLEFLIENFRLVRGGVPSDDVRRSVRKTLRMLFAAAQKERLIPFNPADGLKMPWQIVPVDANDVPTPREMLAVARRLDVVRDVDRFGRPIGEPKAYLGAILRLAYFTGLRASELLALRVDDVNLKLSSITVGRKATVSGGRRVESTILKTKSSARTIPLLPDVRPAVQVLLKNAGREPESSYLCAGEPRLARRRLPDGSYEILTERRAIGYGTLQRHIKMAVDEAFEAGEIRGKFTLHDCRHGFATLLLSGGIDLGVVMEAMGHSSPKLTKGLYGSTRFNTDQTEQAWAIHQGVRKVLTPRQKEPLDMGAELLGGELGAATWEDLVNAGEADEAY